MLTIGTKVQIEQIEGEELSGKIGIVTDLNEWYPNRIYVTIDNVEYEFDADCLIII